MHTATESRAPQLGRAKALSDELSRDLHRRLKAHLARREQLAIVTERHARRALVIELELEREKLLAEQAALGKFADRIQAAIAE